MRPIEQIAIRTRNIEERIKYIGDLFTVEPTKWVMDRVHAVHVFLHPSYNGDPVGSSFQVQLAFNYDFLPMKELELIKLLSGRTVQLEDYDFGGQSMNSNEGLSHLGYHIKDGASLFKELDWWNASGHKTVQVSVTTDHTGTDRRYLYAFLDTRPTVGTFTKVIARMMHPRTVDGLVEEFSRVNHRIV